MLGDDGQLAGGDTKEVLRLGDPESEGVGRGALALPSEGSHADPLLGRPSFRLGGEEGRGKSGVGLLPTEGGSGEQRIRGRHSKPRPHRIGRGIGGGLLAGGDSDTLCGGGGLGSGAGSSASCALGGGRSGGGGRGPLRPWAAAALGRCGPGCSAPCARGPEESNSMEQELSVVNWRMERRL